MPITYWYSITYATPKKYSNNHLNIRWISEFLTDYCQDVRLVVIDMYLIAFLEDFQVFFGE